MNFQGAKMSKTLQIRITESAPADCNFGFCLREIAIAKAEKEAKADGARKERFESLLDLAKEADVYLDKRRRLPAKTVEQIKSLLREGLKPSVILKRFEREGVSRSTVRYYQGQVAKEKTEKRAV